MYACFYFTSLNRSSLPFLSKPNGAANNYVGVGNRVFSDKSNE